MYTILLFYKYVSIGDPQTILEWQRSLWEKYSIKGRLIIANEGVNGTLEIKEELRESFEKEFRSHDLFTDLWFKSSPGTGTAFPKISIKVRPQLVALPTHPDIDPTSEGGVHLSADELHQWYLSGKKFYIVDMRNDYEYEVGHFDNSIKLTHLKNYRDLPDAIEEIAHLKNESVVTFCTGGIRCETASALLQRYGFKDVYQLDGGIHTYLEKYPNGFWSGKLYVFDGRITMGFGGRTEEIIGTCRHCGVKTEEFIDQMDEHRKHQHYLCCEACQLKV